MVHFDNNSTIFEDHYYQTFHLSSFVGYSRDQLSLVMTPLYKCDLLLEESKLIVDFHANLLQMLITD